MRGRTDIRRPYIGNYHEKVLHALALSIFSDNGIEAAAALHELLKWSEWKTPQPTVVLIESLTKFIENHITPWIQGQSIEPAITALTILSNLVNSSDSIPIIPNCIMVASNRKTVKLLLRLSYHPYSPLLHLSQSILEQIGRFCDIQQVFGDNTELIQAPIDPERTESTREMSERSENESNDEENTINTNFNSLYCTEITEFVSTLCSLFSLANPAKDEPHIDIFINFALWPNNCKLFMENMGADVMVNRIGQLLGYPAVTLRDILLEAIYLFCQTNTDFKDAACSSNFLLRALLNLTIPPSEPFESKTVIPFTPCQKACTLLLDLSDDTRVISYLANFKIQLAAAMLKWKSCGLPKLALKVSNASTR